MSQHDHIDEVDLLQWPDPLPQNWTLHPANPIDIHTVYEVRDAGSPRGSVQVISARESHYRDTYPTGVRDRILTLSPDITAEGIQLVSEHLLEADPLCRRLVIVCDEEDVNMMTRAENAGYRYVVDVDLPDESVSLLTAEPRWVLEQSRDIDIVPTS